MRKVIPLFIIIMNVLSVSTFAISAKSAVLIDSASGRVLFEKNKDERLPMASTTKIMTGLLACESKKLSETVTVSPVAEGTEGSSIWLKAGEKLTLEELCYGLMLKSGNDAAVAIAQYLCGSEDAFALVMNKRARAAGANNTCFKNPSGLDAEGHFTTSYDLAMISKSAMQNAAFRKIAGTKNKTIPWEGSKWDRALKNHNKLLWLYEGCNGIKTGFTKKSGRCLVSSAARDNTELIAVTLNAPDDWNDHKAMLDEGFKNYSTRIIYIKGEKVTKYVYDKKRSKRVLLVSENGFSIAVKSGETISEKIEYLPKKPPLKKGETGAIVHIYVNGNEICTTPLVYKSNIVTKDKKKGLIKKLFG